MKNIDVLVIGRACVDYIAVVEKFPEEDKKVPLKYTIMEAGGQGSTAACCIKKLGGNVVYTGKVGDDDEGRFCTKRLKDYKVDIDHVEIVKGCNTPIAYIFVSGASGHRTIIYEPYQLPEIVIDERLKDLIKSSKTVLLDPQATYLGSAIREAAGDSIKIIYDCEREREGLDEMMKVADYFVPSHDFFNDSSSEFFSNETTTGILRLDERINGLPIVTAGREGAYYLLNKKIYYIHAPEIEVKDTIGAGDNFHAAFSLAISMNFDISESVKFAVSVASLSCREHGGRRGIPDFNEAESLARQLEIETISSA